MFCSTCGKETEYLHTHHIVPKVMGGLDIDGNKIAICEECHSLIHNRSMVHHIKLTKEGIAKARNRGVILGRKKGTICKRGWKKEHSPELVKKIQELRRKGLTYKKIAHALDNSITFATVGNILKKYKDCI